MGWARSKIFSSARWTSLGSDLGQVNNPLPIEAYKQIVDNLLDSGVKKEDIQLMIRDNPARLIGLD